MTTKHQCHDYIITFRKRNPWEIDPFNIHREGGLILVCDILNTLGM